MKFTIEETDQLVALDGDAGATLCRVYTGTAENGVRVRFCIAHHATSKSNAGWETVDQHFRSLDDDMVSRAKIGAFLIQPSDTETIELKPPAEA